MRTYPPCAYCNAELSAPDLERYDTGRQELHYICPACGASCWRDEAGHEQWTAPPSMSTDDRLAFAIFGRTLADMPG